LLVLLAGSAPARGQGASGLPFGLIVSEQARTGFTLLGTGARAAGMGGAFTAVADDASAASFNPAGLAQLLEPEFSVVVDGARFRDDYRGFISLDQVPSLPLTDSSLSFDRRAFNFASATLPFSLLKRRFAFQLSAQKLVDFTYEGRRDFTELDPTGAPIFGLVQTSQQSGSIALYSAALSAELTERTLIGVAVNRWIGSWAFTSYNAETPLGAGGETESFTYSQRNELRGWNVDVGLLLRYPRFNVGVRYRTPFDANYDFDATLATNIPTSLQPLPPTTTTLHWPGTLNVGVAWKPSDRWMVALDWGRTDWSAMQFDASSTSGHVNFFDLQSPEATRATVANDFRAGAEFLLFAGKSVIPLRAGWFREPAPSEDAVTGDRIVMQGGTLGVGLKRGWLSLDASVRYATASARVTRFLEAGELASGNLRATSEGTLERRELTLFVSLIVQLPAGSPVREILREIFVGPARKGSS